MPKSKAYTKFIEPTGSNLSEDGLVHQTSPAWVLTFIRWNIRDTLRASSNGDTLLEVREPLIVENDCISLSVNVNKSVLTHSMMAVLKETDANYSTAIAPGDFVFVNILNWEKDAKRIVETVRKSPSENINKENDGFKGVFKIQSVRQVLEVDPNTGTKRLLVKITGFAFTEFNNSIYFNPYASRDNWGTADDERIFMANLSKTYAQLMSPKRSPTCQEIIRTLIESFVGTGVSDQGVTWTGGFPVTANTQFYIPKRVGSLLGVKSAKAAKDIFNYVFGVQQYGGGSSNLSLSVGMNPSNLKSPEGRFYVTKDLCKGQTLLKAEYWNQQKAWSIINQYTNAPLNELYTCFRISPNGKVMPTVVYRQMPFTSDLFGKGQFNSKSSVTRFLNLPRWKISNALIFRTDLGRDETARINYFQFYTRPPSELGNPGGWISAQTASKNFVYDEKDILRSGLRPSILTSSFEDITPVSNPAILAREWALILGDALMGGHLKLNGTIECAGIVDPIAVGDNLEYEGTVYHIEEIAHVCNLNIQNGMKIFRTSIKVSFGVSVDDPRFSLAYPEMQNTNAYNDRKKNYEKGTQILPGISEEQITSYRPKNPSPTEGQIKNSDAPFSQPGLVIKTTKVTKKNE